MKKILLIFCVVLFPFFGVNAEETATWPTPVVDISSLNLENTRAISQENTTHGADKEGTERIQDLVFHGLGITKIIFMGVILIYFVIAGIAMMHSQGQDDEKLASAKRSVLYLMISIFFLNIPGTLYDAFNRWDQAASINVNESVNAESFSQTFGGDNIIADASFYDVIMKNIVGFLEVLIGAFAIFTLITAGYQLMNSFGKQEVVTEAKNRVVYSIIALFFVGFLEAFKRVFITGNLVQWGKVFGDLINLALFLGGGIAMAFLILAGYYAIISNGNEERLKVAKSIVLNVIIGVIIVLGAWSLLIELEAIQNFRNNWI